MPNLGVATLLSIVALENIFSIIVKRRICNRKIFNGNDISQSDAAKIICTIAIILYPCYTIFAKFFKTVAPLLLVALERWESQTYSLTKNLYVIYRFFILSRNLKRLTLYFYLPIYYTAGEH